MDSDFVMRKFWFECLLELWEFSLQEKDTDGLGVDHVHQEIERIIKDFDRFEYTLKASFSEQSLDDNFLDRYESLMRYLNT